MHNIIYRCIVIFMTLRCNCIWGFVSGGNVSNKIFKVNAHAPIHLISAATIDANNTRQPCLKMSASNGQSLESLPQVWSSSVSTAQNLKIAIDQVCSRARVGIPDEAELDLAILHVSSIYGGPEILKDILKSVRDNLPQLRVLVGGATCGVVGMRKGRVLDLENDFCVQLTLASLPGVSVQSFHADSLDAQNDDTFKFNCNLRISNSKEQEAVFLLYSAPSFITCLDKYLLALDSEYPKSIKFGALASTVSSLSKPLLFAVDMDTLSSSKQDAIEATTWLFNSGIVGVTLSGDIQAKSYVMQGVRKIGPKFLCDIVEKGTIYGIKTAGSVKNAPSITPQKAIRNIQQTASELDQLAMKNLLLVGTPSKLMQSSNAEEEKLSTEMLVRTIARGGKEDGSITLAGPEFSRNQEIQFFVRDTKAGIDDVSQTVLKLKKDIEENWTSEESNKSQMSGILFYPSFDRGLGFYGEKSYECTKIFDVAASPLGGFFSNGLIGSLCEGAPTTLFGSSSGFIAFGSKSNRPLFQMPDTDDDEDEMVLISDADENFTIERRDVGSGRALMSGQVQYSVAENKSRPRNVIEQMVWVKETEVDRARDRWPVGPLMTRLMAYNKLPDNKARDLFTAISKDGISLIGEIKGKSPSEALRGKFISYNPIEIAIGFEKGGASAIALHTDFEFFGGTSEDMKSVRHFVTLPVLWMDLVVYVYQLYEARLSGADAIRLVSAVLPKSDLILFHKVALKIGLQVVVTVSTVNHLLTALELDGISMISITQRDLGTWNCDEDRVNRILNDSKVKDALIKAGSKVKILVEGCIKASEEVGHLNNIGINSVIIGEAILAEENIEEATKKFLVDSTRKVVI